MQFTEEDIPLMKLIFNPETHEMGMMLGKERAEEICKYVCTLIRENKSVLIKDTSHFYKIILSNDKLCNFFWDNNILQISAINGYDIYEILSYSPIAEKIWDSEKIDLSELDSGYIHLILTNSPIAEKIWDSGKVDLKKLTRNNIYWILRDSPIAKKIWDSGKIILCFKTE